MKKLFLFLFIIMSINAYTQFTVSRATYLADIDANVFSNNKHQITAVILNAMLKEAANNYWNPVTDGTPLISTTGLIRGINDYTGTTVIKNNAALKILSGGTGSIFSYKRSSTDSSYLQFNNSITDNTSATIASYNSDKFAQIITNTRLGLPAVSIVAQGIAANSAIIMDTLSMEIVTPQLTENITGNLTETVGGNFANSTTGTYSVTALERIEASPTFSITGTGYAVTQSPNDNSTKLANTKYVDNIGGGGYKDSTSVRAFGVNYNPNTSNSTFVTASFSLATALASQAKVEILVNGVVVQTVQATTVALSLAQTIVETVTFIVPKDVVYRFNATDTGGGTSAIISVFEVKL